LAILCEDGSQGIVLTFRSGVCIQIDNLTQRRWLGRAQLFRSFSEWLQRSFSGYLHKVIKPKTTTQRNSRLEGDTSRLLTQAFLPKKSRKMLQKFTKNVRFIRNNRATKEVDAMMGRLIQFMREELGISENAIAIAQRHHDFTPNLLPMILWQYGLITLQDLECIFDWLERA
jgi:Protein of unknown function (DUF2949)